MISVPALSIDMCGVCGEVHCNHDLVTTSASDTLRNTNNDRLQPPKMLITAAQNTGALNIPSSKWLCNAKQQTGR